ncbi:phosphatidylglycerol lysyltransferase domain-containing protein, partial [Candidatus Bathyarchaeota archaeon]|nr:phosphatidylglycerol lysyltransferase domain-containing protein [Candidatus Bathyarchaeota archaeon]
PLFAVALTGYVAMIIIMSFSPFMRGLGAVELSLTYLLVQFGYETSLAASITLIFRFFEFWLPLAIGLFVFIIKKESVLLRLIPSLLLLVSGIVNVVSVLTPAIPVRLAFINNRIPEDLVQFSNFGVLIFGIVLIVISGYLFMGSKNAWKTALVLTLFSALGHLTKAVDYEEATVSFVTFLSLLYTRKSYFLKHNIPLQIRKLKRVSLFVALFFVYGILGFYLLDKIHFRKDLTLIDSVQMFYQSLLGQQHYVPRTNFAKEFIYSLRFAGAGIILYVIWLFMVPLKNKKSQINEERQLANELIKKIGNSRLDYFKAYFDKLFYFNPLKTGFLSYKIANNYAVVLENPVCATTQEIIDLIFDFKQHCRINGLGLFFYRIPETYLDLYKSCDFKSILIGQEAIVSLDTFSLVGSERSSLRNVLNSVKKKGFSSKIYEPPLKDGLIQKLENVSDEWLTEHKMSEVAFTQGIFNKKELKDSVLITVENNEEEIVAFVNLIPDYNKVEGTYDLIRRAEDAPNGVVDFL